MEELMRSVVTFNKRLVDKQDDAPALKKYNPPHLEKLGDLRSITLGGSPGAVESGFPNPDTKPQLPPFGG
jgi:hypothetical protein